MNMLVPPAQVRQRPTDAEIIQLVGQRPFTDGEYYDASGRVRQVTVAEDGSVVEAVTRGTAARPYHQHITLRQRTSGSLDIRGTCTCPVGFNCKHVAAALIAARRTYPLGPAEAAWAPPQPGSSLGEPALSAELGAWLRDIGEHGQPDPERQSAEKRYLVLFVLSLNANAPGISTLAIQPFGAELRKGRQCAERQLPPDRWTGPRLPTYSQPEDRLLLNRLVCRYQGVPTPEDDPPETLRRIIATGHARWGSVNGPVVAEGLERAGRLGWRMNKDCSQVLTIESEPGLCAIRIPEPWYVEPETGLLGPLALEIPERVATRLLAAPPIPAPEANRVRSELARRFAGIAIPPPAEMPEPELVQGPPQPCLRLLLGPEPTVLNRYATGPKPRRPPMARLSFCYGPVTTPFRKSVDIVSLEGRLYRVMQDKAAENAAAAELSALGFQRHAEAQPYSWNLPNPDDLVLPGDDSTGWLRMLVHEVPRLRRAGWQIEIDPDFPLRVVEPEGDFTAELEEGSGIDWLELHLGVLVEGERVDLVPGLVKLIATTPGEALTEALGDAADDTPFVVPLSDGRLLSLPLGRIRTMLLALADLFAAGGIDAEAGRVGFTRLNAAELAVLETAVPDLVWRGGEALRALGRQLREAGDTIPPAALPEAFSGTLRPYQAQGVDWLQFLRGAGIGAVLADDMGLGKTVQTLAHLVIEHAEGRLDRPALIVCPTSLVPNWAAEAERFAPGLRLLVLHGPTRRERFTEIPAHDLVITSYALISRDAEVLTAQDWHIVVLDEAQMIKNPAAETTKLVAGLKGRQRLCLSGTPLENHLGELWSLFNFLAPGFLGSHKSFRSRYRVPIEKRGDEARRALLARRVLPFLLRRTKEEVATDLPPKTEIVEQVELEPAQRAIYESIRLAMHERVRKAISERGLARSGIIILDALLKLRQACCDPRLLKIAAVKRTNPGSAKLERLMELLTTLLDEGRRVLVFSQFTSMLELIIPRLDDADISFALLTGDTIDRQTPIRRFQSGEVPVFLLSLKAGGKGLNLTAADTVIHYDPWWNPAVEDQATDRAHRIGQSKPVFVHRLVTIDTIEQKMEVLKARKRALVAGILDAERGGTLTMTEADIEMLFG